MIRGKSLRIHAAPHQHPLLQGDPSTPNDAPLIDTDSDLVLEGIQFERHARVNRGTGSARVSPTSQPLIRTVGTQFRAANCRFSTSPNADGLITERVSLVSLRNCQFSHPAGFAISCLPHPEQKFFIQNCILHSQGASSFNRPKARCVSPGWNFGAIPSLPPICWSRTLLYSNPPRAKCFRVLWLGEFSQITICSTCSSRCSAS